MYHYAGNNPIRYSDPDGRSLLGNLCYVGAALVLAAGTTVSVVSGCTLAVFVEPAAVKASLALAATGLAINTSEVINDVVNNNQSNSLSFSSSSSTAAAASPSPLPPDPDEDPNFKNSKDTAKDFKTDTKNFERNIKQDILKDSRIESSTNKDLSRFLKQNSNPDIGTTKNGDIWLKSRTTGEVIKTGLKVSMYLE